MAKMKTPAKILIGLVVAGVAYFAIDFALDKMPKKAETTSAPTVQVAQPAPAPTLQQASPEALLQPAPQPVQAAPELPTPTQSSNTGMAALLGAGKK